MELIFATTTLGIGYPLLSQSAEQAAAGIRPETVPGGGVGTVAAMMDHPGVRVVELSMASFKVVGVHCDLAHVLALVWCFVWCGL